MNYDFIIVGAGFAGLVLAERISTQLDKKCLIIDRRSHIGGNAHDEYDDAGVLIHTYGPHYFRTDSERVQSYLSQFTEWLPVNYEIRSYTRGQYWNFPINLNTFEQYIGRASTREEFESWLDEHRIRIDRPANSEELILAMAGPEFYEMFYRGYTVKQWREDPRNIDPEVCGRISIRTDRNNGYVSERFQALPRDGYHVLFDNMINACGGNADLMLGTEYEDVKSKVFCKHLIYTGSPDEYYEFALGKLPYRSLRFARQSFDANELFEREAIAGKKGFWQPTVQVNYPNDNDFTRIVETKHITGQQCDVTTIVREYPQDYSDGAEPYYPVPTGEAAAIYRKYEELAGLERRVTFIGRLANYKYYNMDRVIEKALDCFERMRKMI
ncbi:MAG: NAD(P)-binding protein [Lentisphaerae bacterium]|nr:NAD(P)-binding protein [Lentisphaerota bacterium]